MSRDFEPYSKYKDSGVAWLGEVPEHWSVKRNKRILWEIDERSKAGDEELLSVSQYTGVTPRRERQATQGGLLTNAESLVGHKRVMSNDLVINIMLAWNGSLGVSPQEGIVSTAYCVFRAKAGVEPRFLHYLFRTPLLTGVFKAVSTGVVDSRLRLYPDKFFGLPTPLPPLNEQVAMVRFLDHTDRRIRRNIATKRKLIALLREQRQAITHRVMTGGLEPHVPLRASGYEWFPEIPHGWQLLPLRRLILRAVDGPHVSPSYVDQGVPFLSARNVKADRWSLEDAKFISEADHEDFSRRVRPQRGDVLYTKGGTTGVARAVDLDFAFQVWVHVAVLKVNKQRVTPPYLAAALNSPRCYEQSQLLTRGATNQDLGLGRMKGIMLPVPPLWEQDAIIRHLERSTSQTFSAEQSAQREIDLLREYRIRLISDVVTGKIDVREAAARLPDSVYDPGPLDETGADQPDDDADLDADDEEAVS